ncbi:MAG: DUF4286 family protein [Chitinophagaceae bacterium]|nr:DUF4286 family protein [Chitinophagaceae bacterium]
MIIYNVTTKISNDIHNEWLLWLKEEHIPDIINTGCFTHAVILQLLDTDDTEGPTYAIQYHTKNKELYYNYINGFAAIMRQKSFDKWGDRFISFRTLMHIVG